MANTNCVSEVIGVLSNILMISPLVMLALLYILAGYFFMKRGPSNFGVVVIISLLALDLVLIFVFPYASILLSAFLSVFVLSQLASRMEYEVSPVEPLNYVHVLVGLGMGVIAMATDGINVDTLFYTLNTVSVGYFLNVFSIRSFLSDVFIGLSIFPHLAVGCSLGLSHPVLLSLSMTVAVMEIKKRLEGKTDLMRSYSFAIITILMATVIVSGGITACLVQRRTESLMSRMEKSAKNTARVLIDEYLENGSLDELMNDQIFLWNVSYVVLEKNGEKIYQMVRVPRACIVGKAVKGNLTCYVGFNPPFVSVLKTISFAVITSILLFSTLVILFQRGYLSRLAKYLGELLELKTSELTAANQELVAMNEELMSMSRDVERMYKELSDLSERMLDFLEFVETVSIADDMEVIFEKLTKAVGNLLKIDVKGYAVLDLSIGEIVVESGSRGISTDLNVGNYILRVYHDSEISLSEDEKRFLDMVSSVVSFVLQAKRAYEELSKSERASSMALNLLNSIMRARDRQEVENVLLKNLKGLFDDAVVVGIGWKEDLRPNGLLVRFVRSDSSEVETTFLKGRGIMRIVLESGEEYLVQDVYRDPNFLIVDPKSRSAFAVPLEGEDSSTLGVMIIERSTLNAFSPMDMNTLRIFARITAVALQKMEYQTDLKKALLGIVEALAFAIELKDPYTHGHSRRVADYSLAIAKAMDLSQRTLERIELAALLHDIGKIGVRGYVLNKPTRLTPEEFEEIKRHPVLGEKLVEKVEQFKDIAKIIRHHHERWGGGGYPDGLKDGQIPLESRIIAIADAFDAMTSDRPYRKAFSVEKALRIIEENQQLQWDPEIIPIAVEVLRNIDSTSERGRIENDLPDHVGDSSRCDNRSFGEIHKQSENGSPAHKQEEGFQPQSKRDNTDLERGESDRGYDQEDTE